MKSICLLSVREQAVVGRFLWDPRQAGGSAVASFADSRVQISSKSAQN
jgi:hypothetical protein